MSDQPPGCTASEHWSWTVGAGEAARGQETRAPAGQANELRVARNPAVRRPCIPLIDVRDRLVKGPVLRRIGGQIHCWKRLFQAVRAQSVRKLVDGTIGGAVRERGFRGPVCTRDDSPVASSTHSGAN